MSALVTGRRIDRRRWWWCFAAIVMVHAGAVWFAVHWPVESAARLPPVVMTIDLAPPIAARPRAPVETHEQLRPVAHARPPQPVTHIVVPRAPAPRVAVALTRPVRPVAPQSPAQVVPPAARADVAQPPAVTPPQALAPPAPEIAATAPGVAAAAPPSNAVPSWQGLLLGRLEKFKRYPSSAQFRHQQGVVYLRFAMDRAGHVVSASIDKGSGFEALDAEALALVHRAEPLPPPPPEVSGNPIELVVPIQFFLKPAS